MTDPTASDPAPEPSMEEILASIRQIISEDLASVAAGESRSEARPEAEDDVLILRERAPPEPSPFAPRPEEVADPAAAAPVTPAAEEEEPLPAAEGAAAEPVRAGAAAPEPAPYEPEAGEGRSLALAPAAGTAIVAHETAAVVAASFERLAIVVDNMPSPPPFPVSPGGATLEDITREILAPVIKAWLDENLPAIVQARVDEEVERIARRRVR